MRKEAVIMLVIVFLATNVWAAEVVGPTEGTPAKVHPISVLARNPGLVTVAANLARNPETMKRLAKLTQNPQALSQIARLSQDPRAFKFLAQFARAQKIGREGRGK